MATETIDLLDVTFTVNAWGAPAGGKWPHFVLRLDGVDIGEATVASATQSRYTFTAKVPASQAHKLQLQYDNDGSVNGEDRNLFIKSFEVNGTQILSIDPLVKYDTGDIDGRNVIAGQTEMYWRGAMNVDLPQSLFTAAPPPPTTTPPATMTTQIAVTAWGVSANGTPPHFKLLVDDKVVGDAWVNAASPTDYMFTVNVDPNEAHKIQVHYDNDATVNGQDRNLFVQGIRIDGQTIKATDPLASYDKGPVDGKYVVAGQEGLYWGGALTFGVPEEYFGGAYVPPPPPPPPVPTTMTDIVVTAYGQSAGGVPPHFKLLVDGKVIGEGRATSGEPTAFAFKADLDPTQAHKIQIHYDNDSVVNGQDRNLYVKSVAINGKTVAVTDPIVTYDKGAFDGKDVVKGQEGLYWGGALTVAAPAEFFQPAPPPPAPAPQGPAFYVAANGKDTWSGKLAAPNADGTDGPFASLERARDAMRSSDIDTTYVREGTYRLTKTLELTALDKGHAFKNYPGETPILNGAEKVTGFTHEGNGVYSAKLATATDMDLTIGGVRQTLASKAQFDADDVTSGWYFADAAASGPSGWSIRYHTGDISKANLAPGTKIQVMDAERLSDTITEVAGIDDATRTITLKNGTSLPFAEGTTYKLLGNAAFVDQAGEFAWRAADGRVVFKPADPASLGQDGVEVARLGTLIRLNGASDVTIEGLGFTNTTTYGNALELVGASNNRIGDNSFVNVGTAIKLKAASLANLIGGNRLDHMAVSGIDLEGRSNGNTIYANDISHIGEVRKAVAGIMGTGVDSNLIAHNDVDSSARYGISLKNWDSTNINRNNVIEYNKVTNTNLETADGGGIEILGRSSVNTGNIVRGNWVENVVGVATSNTDQWLVHHKGFGIYLDDMAGGITVADNFLKNTGWAGVHIHGGDNNLVTNNFSIIASNAEEFIRVGWAPKHGDPGLPRNNTITGNVVSGTLPLDDYMELLTAGDPLIDRNLVHNVPRYGDNDVTGKPLFANPYYGDYSLLPDSPALAMGIHDLAWARMGADGYTAAETMPAFWDAY